MIEARKAAQAAQEETLRKEQVARDIASTQFNRQKELAKYKSDLAKAEIDPQEKRLKELKIQKLEKDLEDPIKQLTPSEQLALDSREKDELASVAAFFVDNNGKSIAIPYEERKANAEQANNRPGNKVFYLTTDPVQKSRFGFDILAGDEPGTVEPIFLPKNPKTNEQVTSQQILETAVQNNMSIEEVLKVIGAR